jgi:cobalt/nickel transport system permease protein
MSGTFSLHDFLAAEASLYRQAPRGLARWDARLKLGLATAAILANVLLPSAPLSTGLWLAAWLGLGLSRVAWRQAALFIFAPLWTTLMVVVGFSWGFGTTVLVQWGPLTFYREGLLMGLAAGLRVLAEMSWMAALILTTPFTEILAALRWFRVPEVVVDLLAAMYRYVFLLFDEYQTMRSAAMARGGFQDYRTGMATMGQILAQIFMRALERAERVDQAMRVRGRDSAPSTAPPVLLAPRSGQALPTTFKDPHA